MEPQMNADARRWDEMTEETIGCAFRVANVLACDLLEKAIEIELSKTGLNAKEQAAVQSRRWRVFRGPR